MKKLSIIIALLVCTMFTSICHAQALEEVTLTVSSDGPTKDEAVKNALRSAIEQAYGAFVSANTTILNDELVKDEIVTVSNGSIKEYKELGCGPTNNGGQFVTLQATVSLPHLIKYSQSKGSECEFAGNTFAINEKLRNIRKNNTVKILKDIEELFRETDNLYDFKLSIEEPYEEGDNYIIDAIVGVYPNATYLNLVSLYANTLEELGDEFIYPVSVSKKRSLPISLNLLDRISQEELLHKRGSTSNAHRIDDKYYAWKGDCIFDIKEILIGKQRKFIITDNLNSPTKVKIRFGYKYTDNWCSGLCQETGSTYTSYGFGSISKPYKESNYQKDFNAALKSLVDHRKRLNKSGQCVNDLLYDAKIVKHEESNTWAIEFLWFDPDVPLIKFDLKLLIPKSEIGKYTNFKVEPANK